MTSTSLPAGGNASLLDGALETVGHEGERRGPFADRFASVVRHDETRGLRRCRRHPSARDRRPGCADPSARRPWRRWRTWWQQPPDQRDLAGRRTSQACRASPPVPIALSTATSGPATYPSSDTLTWSFNMPSQNLARLIACRNRFSIRITCRFPFAAGKSGCPINMTAELLGDRWSLVVLRDIMFGGFTHFHELLTNSHEGIASNILSARLAKLVRRRGCSPATMTPRTSRRSSTTSPEPAIQLVPVIATLGEWGARWLPTEPELDDPRPTARRRRDDDVGAIHRGDSRDEHLHHRPRRRRRCAGRASPAPTRPSGADDLGVDDVGVVGGVDLEGRRVRGRCTRRGSARPRRSRLARRAMERVSNGWSGSVMTSAPSRT